MGTRRIQDGDGMMTEEQYKTVENINKNTSYQIIYCNDWAIQIVVGKGVSRRFYKLGHACKDSPVWIRVSKTTKTCKCGETLDTNTQCALNLMLLDI
jgi:hypothetical protein